MTTTPQAALLSQAELSACMEAADYTYNPTLFARAVEQAVIAKLQATQAGHVPYAGKMIGTQADHDFDKMRENGATAWAGVDAQALRAGHLTKQVEPAQAGALPDSLALVIEKLERFQECSEDSGAGGCDIGRDWFDALTTIGLLRRVQRSPGLWEMTSSGSALLSRAALAARKPLSDSDIGKPLQPSPGDYVLATKWSDGDPGDPWAIGFYAGVEYGDRHMVKDSSGKYIRPNGYRRVGRITHDMGNWLWVNRDLLECAPAKLNLWGLYDWSFINEGINGLEVKP